MKKRGLQYRMLPVITVIVELRPYGAVCNFGNPEGEPWRETFSYFDLTPFGYANFAPFLTAIMKKKIGEAIRLVLALLVIYALSGKRGWALAARNILAMGVVVSLGPLVFGISYFSLVGGLITAALTMEIFMLHKGLQADPEE